MDNDVGVSAGNNIIYITVTAKRKLEDVGIRVFNAVKAIKLKRMCVVAKAIIITYLMAEYKRIKHTCLCSVQLCMH